MSKNFYLWGWSGQLNAGDDIFAYVVAWGLRRHMRARQLFMDADLSGVLSRQCQIQTAEPARWRVPGLTRWRRARFRRAADCFVLAGGTLLPHQRGVEALLADDHWDHSGRRRIALGLSVGPFESASHEQAIVKLLDKLNYVAFRDDQSYDWAVANGVKAKIIKAFDLAVLFPLALPESRPERGGEKVLGISLLPYHFYKNPALLSKDLQFARQTGAAVARALAGQNVKIVFLSLCLNPVSDDRQMARAFAEGNGNQNLEVFSHNGDPVRTFQKVRACSHIFSMRLHGGIMAFAAGIPFLQLEYHPKCRDFAQTIGLADSHRMSLQDYSSDLCSSKVSELLKLNSVQSHQTLAATQQRALLNFSSVQG